MINTIGMIGTGNMGSAILRGIVDASYVKAAQIIAYDASSRRMSELEEDIPGIITARDCLEVAEKADLIILAIKPIYVKDVIEEIHPALNGKAVLSIAAGWTVSMLGLTASSCMRAALKSPVSGSCGTACPAKTPKLTLLPSRRSSILEMRRRARSRRLGDASRASIELDTSSMKHTSIPPFPCVTVFSPYCGRATITIKAARAPITSENFSPRRMRERRGAIWSSRSASARRTLRERAW